MLEIQDIFRQHMDGFLDSHNLTHVQTKATNAILSCRTAALGAHIDYCDECGFERISYNSCRNRHCPKCQTFAKEDWVDRQKQNLIGSGYFHVVFTVPAALRPVFYQHQALMYTLLFRAASETLLEMCDDKRHLGAKPGITAILHTWGQNLSYHPHLHCVVTGGGLVDGRVWRTGKKKFFLPVKAVSRKFRGKLLYLLQKQGLVFYGSLSHLNDPCQFNALTETLYGMEWVVYCKPPFGDAGKVMEYLGRYTHRVAISNDRLVSMEDGIVTFRWRDYGDGNKQKVMTLGADEFIRRFLTHILPKGFRKIRHYGIFASRDKGDRLALCKWLTNSYNTFVREPSALERMLRIFGPDWGICPSCRKGHMSRASPQPAY